MALSGLFNDLEHVHAYSLKSMVFEIRPATHELCGLSRGAGFPDLVNGDNAKVTLTASAWRLNKKCTWQYIVH